MRKTSPIANADLEEKFWNKDFRSFTFSVSRQKDSQQFETIASLVSYIMHELFLLINYKLMPIITVVTSQTE